jgi:DegV family protein with EDD domain
MPVAVVTDSTSCLPADVLRRYPVTVVPLPVTINGISGAEGVDITTADMARAFGQRRLELSTSRPSPGDLAAVYRRLLDGGATGVVSVHLSKALSGTCEAAELAAREFGDRVRVVDSANAGMGVGFCVMAAVAAAGRGRSLAYTTAQAEQVSRSTQTFFYVDTLEFLRRGGRIGAASALLGTALAVKPILHVEDGKVELRERVRTATRALARLEDLIVAAGGEGAVDVALHHLQSPERAEGLGVRLRERFGRRLRQVHVSEVGAVIAAHCGPGLLGAVVCRRT